jgi:colanic acid/amylovoran biosynthesis protein
MTENPNPRIMLTGLTSGGLGMMEVHNLGNYLILEPLLENLRAEFPTAILRTTLQLSENTCKRFNITCLRHPRFWTYAKVTAFHTLTDWLRLGLYHLFGRRPQSLIQKSLLLRELASADMVLDLGGDLFGDNSAPLRFLEGASRMLMARALGKPVIHFASSPGPFTRSFWHRWLGPLVLNRITLLTNREPISTQLLIQLGVKPSQIVDTACPSFLYASKPKIDPREILQAEGINPSRPIIGVILCGWNMPKPPYTKVPRDPEELQAFLPMLNRLLAETDAQLLLMSHSHRTAADGSLKPGPDATIMGQFHDALQPASHPDRVFLLKGLYDATDMRGVLSRLDLLVSGRLHGAVSGMTSLVPTVIVDYGHEPKAHKLRGLAELMQISEYLVDPSQPERLGEVVMGAWTHRKDLHAHLQRRLPEVQALARKNFNLLHAYLGDHAVD